VSELNPSIIVPDCVPDVSETLSNVLRLFSSVTLQKKEASRKDIGAGEWCFWVQNLEKTLIKLGWSADL